MTLSIYGNWLKQSSSSFVLCLGSESKFSKAGSQEGKVMLSWAEDEIGGLDCVSGREGKDSLEEGKTEAGGTKESGQGPG